MVSGVRDFRHDCPAEPSRRGVCAAAACVALMSVGLARSDDLARRDAARFLEKVEFITGNGQLESPVRLRTPVSEREVNAYLKFEAGDQIPVGVRDPRIAILGDGRLAGQAIVDLDAVRRARGSGRWLDPVSYLSGQLTVAANGRLETRAGVGRFHLGSATLAGVSIPKGLLQELVSYYTRSAHHPRGIALDDPFTLPAEIREIKVGKGEAIVVQ
jgi:hypothetical protein